MIAVWMAAKDATSSRYKTDVEIRLDRTKRSFQSMSVYGTNKLKVGIYGSN